MPGGIVFAAGALTMAWDFIVKLRPLYPNLISGLLFGDNAAGEKETVSRKPGQ